MMSFLLLRGLVNVEIGAALMQILHFCHKTALFPTLSQTFKTSISFPTTARKITFSMSDYAKTKKKVKKVKKKKKPLKHKPASL
jgi:hypothetical protein